MRKTTKQPANSANDNYNINPYIIRILKAHLEDIAFNNSSPLTSIFSKSAGVNATVRVSLYMRSNKVP